MKFVADFFSLFYFLSNISHSTKTNEKLCKRKCEPDIFDSFCFFFRCCSCIFKLRHIMFVLNLCSFSEWKNESNSTDLFICLFFCSFLFFFLLPQQNSLCNIKIIEKRRRKKRSHSVEYSISSADERKTVELLSVEWVNYSPGVLSSS